MLKLKKYIKTLKKNFKFHIYRPLKRKLIKYNLFPQVNFAELIYIKRFLNIRIWFQNKIKTNSKAIFNFGALLILLAYYYPFFKYLNFEVARYFKPLNLLLMDGLFMYFFKYYYPQTLSAIFIYILLERYIYKYNNKKNAKSTYTDRAKYTPQIFERLFVFLNYFGFWVSLAGGHLKLTNRLLKRFFPRNDYRAYFYDGILIKCLLACTQIPGYTRGIHSFISLYTTYSLIIRNNKIFPYFIRYHFMAAQLSAILMDLIYTIFSFFLKYYLYINHRHHRRYKFLLNYNLYIVYSFYIFYCMIVSLMGRLIPINFLNSAIFWHVGIDKRA
jgi:hypothetical protein